jgi:hypothetical protein
MCPATDPTLSFPFLKFKVCDTEVYGAYYLSMEVNYFFQKDLESENVHRQLLFLYEWVKIKKD